MATRELKVRWEPVVCEICGRSLLRGEHPVRFYDGQAAHEVCDLCTSAAHRQGWLREGTQRAQAAPAAHSERARSLVARLRIAREPVREGGERREEREERDDPLDDLPHHVQALPTGASAQLSLAVELFNASTHAATVAGVLHSLGAPYVHARAADGEPLVEITVVWELCWYRFEVDLENEAVRQRGQGYEPAELGGDLPAANATADEAGKLALAQTGLT
jgi:hypothetical protein